MFKALKQNKKLVIAGTVFLAAVLFFASGLRAEAIVNSPDGNFGVDPNSLSLNLVGYSETVNYAIRAYDSVALTYSVVSTSNNNSTCWPKPFSGHENGFTLSAGSVIATYLTVNLACFSSMGTYTAVFRIAEQGNPSNYVDTTLTVNVQNKPVPAVSRVEIFPDPGVDLNAAKTGDSLRLRLFDQDNNPIRSPDPDVRGPDGEASDPMMVTLSWTNNTSSAACAGQGSGRGFSPTSGISADGYTQKFTIYSPGVSYSAEKLIWGECKGVSFKIGGARLSTAYFDPETGSSNTLSGPASTLDQPLLTIAGGTPPPPPPPPLSIISSSWRIYRKNASGIIEPTPVRTNNCAGACDFDQTNLPAGNYTAFLTVTNSNNLSDTARKDFSILGRNVLYEWQIFERTAAGLNRIRNANCDGVCDFSALGLAAGNYRVALTLRNSVSQTVSSSRDFVVLPTSTAGFSLGVAPQRRDVTRGMTTTYTVTVSSTRGFSGVVSLATSTGLPAEIRSWFSPTSVVVPANGSVTSVLTIQVGTGAPLGAFSFRVTGRNSGTTVPSNQISLAIGQATHTACSNQSCVSVAGPGVNRCSVNSDCVPQFHAECDREQEACVNKAGVGPSTCSNDAQCTGDGPDHLECQNNSCVIVSGAGANQCSTVGGSCTPPTHTECRNQACAVVAGAGQNRCAASSDCGPVFHGECDSVSRVCVNRAGPLPPGRTGCRSDAQCGGEGDSHRECRNRTCVIVDGAGTNQCATIGSGCSLIEIPPR